MGIANIINTSTSSGGGGGEIIRELVNSSDGQGLYFSNTGYIHLANNAAVEFGTSDFSIEFVMNQTGEVGSSGGSIYQSATTVNNKFSIENHVSSNVVRLIFFNAVGSATQYDLSYNMAADYNEPTHYVVSCDRSGNAVLYRNGTEVASVSIATSASINLGDGVTSTAMIGNSGSGYTFLGGLYRFRTWNKALTHDEVDTCFQRADVPFADQYGSETSLVDANASTFVGTSTYGWVKYGNNTIANTSNQLVITYVDNVQGAYNYLKDSTDLTTNLTVGKKYKVKIDAKYAGGSAGVKLRIANGVATTEFATLTTSLTTYEVEFTAQSATGCYINLGDMSASNVVTLDNFYVYSCGVLTDHDLAFANPTQSLMVQDRAGAADGTCSASGVTQTQPIVQLNSTSARIGTSAATPADGELAVGSKIGISTTGSARQLHVKNTSGYAGAEFEATAENDDAFVTFNTHGNAAYIGIDDSADVLKLNATSGLSSASHIAITSNGNVGINVASAGYKLDVEESSGNEIARFQGANSGTLTFRNDAANEFRMYAGAGDSLGFSGGNVYGSSHLTISAAGVLGVGNPDPNGAIEVSRGGSGTESIISTWSTTDAEHSQLSLKKSGSSTIGTRAVTSDGEPLGSINAYGVDTNTDQRRAARIEFNQGAAATGSKVAGNIVFKTSSTSANDVERLKIGDGGQVTVGIDADPSQTASPSMLVTAATAPSDVNGYSQLVLQRTDGHYNADGAQIMFNQGYHSGNTDYPAPVAAIRGFRTGPDTAYGGGLKLCYQPNNAALGVAAGLVLDGSGNVSIGSLSSASGGQLHVDDALGAIIGLSRTTGAATQNLGIIRFGNTNVDSNLASIAAVQDGASDNSRLEFRTQASGSEAVTRVTINKTGYTLFNCTGVPSSSVAGMAIYGSSSANSSSSGSSTTAYNHWIFLNGNGQVGSIQTSASATTYNTSSDYRLKENLEPLTGALERIEQLPVYRFNFKADSETTVDGFVAHEAATVVPEAVTGEKDAMKTVVVQEAVEAVEYQPAIEAVEYQPAIEAVEYQAATYYIEGDELPEGVKVGDIKTEEIQAVEGRPEIQAVQGQPEIEAVEAQEEVTEEQIDPQGIDQSKLVPLLVAAVKELKAKVEALENA